jgi:hypothetical protein
MGWNDADCGRPLRRSARLDTDRADNAAYDLVHGPLTTTDRSGILALLRPITKTPLSPYGVFGPTCCDGATIRMADAGGARYPTA